MEQWLRKFMIGFIQKVKLNLVIIIFLEIECG